MKLKEALLKVRDEIFARAKTPEMPIGLSAVDEVLWGLKRKETTIIAARPSVGKTAFAEQIAENLSKPPFSKRVVVFSLEMAIEGIAERLIAKQLAINSMRLERNQITETEIQEIINYTTTIDDVDMDILDDSGFAWADINQYCIENNPDIIFIDFIQMTKGEERESDRLVYQEYMRRMRIIAKEHNVSIVICSQLNRDAEGKDHALPLLSHLKGSGALEENADNVILLHYPWRYDDTKDKNDFIVYVAKKKNGGQPKVVHVMWQPEIYKFSDLAVQP